jgi:hypothetical protein
MRKALRCHACRTDSSFPRSQCPPAGGGVISLPDDLVALSVDDEAGFIRYTKQHAA